MSDLALPFLLLIEDDALAFWCFVALMRKVRRMVPEAAVLLHSAGPQPSCTTLFQVRLNFAVEDDGIFAQLSWLACLLEALEPALFEKLKQVRQSSPS